MGLKGIGLLPDDWREGLGWAPEIEILQDLEQRVTAARAEGDVFPASGEVFAALRLTPLANVRAVIIGQDPYHGLGEAHGLAFSVRDTFQPLPPSLRNIRRELQSDLDIDAPPGGSLETWARNGVLLLNSILTVRRDRAGSHRSFGWDRVTIAVLDLVAQQEQPIAFLLWGGFAKKLARGNLKNLLA
jgi:uracil-DNA glycosylase